MLSLKYSTYLYIIDLPINSYDYPESHNQQQYDGSFCCRKVKHGTSNATYFTGISERNKADIKYSCMYHQNKYVNIMYQTRFLQPMLTAICINFVVKIPLKPQNLPYKLHCFIILYFIKNALVCTKICTIYICLSCFKILNYQIVTLLA